MTNFRDEYPPAWLCHRAYRGMDNDRLYFSDRHYREVPGDVRRDLCAVRVAPVPGLTGYHYYTYRVYETRSAP